MLVGALSLINMYLNEFYRYMHKTRGCLGFTPTKCARVFSVFTKLHKLCIARQVRYDGEMVEGEGDDEIWQQNNGPNAVAARNAVINSF